MRKTNSIIFIIALLVFASTFLLSLVSFPGLNADKPLSSSSAPSSEPRKLSFIKTPSSGVYRLLGKKDSEIVRIYGKPERVDPTNYGYSWHIYGINTENYLQIGIDQRTNRVTTVYALGANLKTGPFPIGASSQKIFSRTPVSDDVVLKDSAVQIDFELNEEDMMTRPLLKLGDNWVQLNFDHIADKLVAVRYMNAEVLKMIHPYSLTYEGVLPKRPTISATEWPTIDAANDQEIFDISNLLRARYQKNKLIWNAAAHTAAFKHSKEMKVKKYFSHDSKWSGNLQTRLQAEKIQFEMAGENIAANYPDAPAVSLGWLNSPDHRENLLNNAFTQLGVGSYQQYYTQDFIRP
ncbi:MAG: CAP domain-containing protein [Sporolactobacillus sp.]